MQGFARPVVVVSKCLGFEACRYNGEALRDPAVEALKAHVEFRPVCPEMAIGLGVPRAPVRIIRKETETRLIQPTTKLDVTQKMADFCEDFLRNLGPVDGFLLKYRSPSCGPGNVKIYHGEDKGAGTSRGSGLFAAEVIRRFPNAPLEDEGRLNDFVIRERFFTALFTLARYREARENGSIQALIEFHTRNKLLLMAYHQAKMRAMGRVLAGYKAGDPAPLAIEVEVLLKEALATPVKTGAMINALQHAFGGLSAGLSSDERVFFSEKIEEVRDERIPLSVLTQLIHAWSVRQGNDYLLGQTLLRPFPTELVKVRDSGKGIQ